MDQSKECSICLETKPASEFYVSGKYLYSHCKICKRDKDKNIYHTNVHEKTRRLRLEKASRHIRRLKAQIFVYGILSISKCIDCGEARLETLDFDHVSGIKTRAISSMIRKGLQIEDIKNEITKCDIRCANCHRIKTSKQLGWIRSNWNEELAKLELAKCIQQAPKRKPATKRNAGKRAL